MTLDPNFPVFVLCGVLIADSDYDRVRQEFNALKDELWQNREVIFHSRDIRKCEKEFQILFDMDVKQRFYKKLNDAIETNKYTVIASAIQKERYIRKYGRLSNDVYELALSFIIERTVFCLDEHYVDKQLEIIIEKRGRSEDKRLAEHFQRLMARGTAYVNAGRLQALGMKITFRDKKENINGLQLADLVAYPIARYVIEPKRANPAMERFENKIYSRRGKRYGLKIFP